MARFFFLLFLIALFFPIRYVFPTASSFATGLYSDFTSISLYLSDIFLFIAFIFILWSNKTQIKLFVNNKLIIAFLLWLFIGLAWQFKSISALNIWYFVKFLELTIVAYGTTKLVFSDQSLVIRKQFLLVFVCLGTLQSVIGLLQYINQSPIGLNLIGEQVIGPNLWGVAKVACPVACQFIGSATGVSSGTVLIRAYGTFPHPNLLSAFLLTTIFINTYLLTSTTWKKTTQIWLNLALFINILGLTATFSRGAFLALAIGLVIYFAILIKSKLKIKDEGLRIKSSIVIVIVSLATSFILFHPFLLSRATFSDPATVERKIYNQTALNMIKDKPFFGLGIGESVLHMKQYSSGTNFLEKNLVLDMPWQIQPIHNYFLLSAAELGIPGALILIWIFLSHLKAISYKLKAIFDPYNLLLATIMISFLVLMIFDHYFYTLQQTQMLLWVVLGLITAATKNPQTGD